MRSLADRAPGAVLVASLAPAAGPTDLRPARATGKAIRLVAAALAWLAAACATPAQDRMTPELLWRLARVSGAAVSPDGGRVLYHVRRYALAANSGETQVWLLDTATGTHRQLTTIGSNFGACWSPDGSEIAFLSTRDGAPQVYRIALAGGEARRITEHPGGCSNLSWSPDGAHFAFTAHVQLDPDVRVAHPDLPHADARVYDDLMVRHWDEWKDGSYSHLFVVPADGGPARDLMAGERVDTPLKPFGGGEQIAWSPDGAELCYTAKRVDDPEASTDSDLWVVPVGGGAHRNLTRGMPGYETNPAYAPDGGSIAFLSMARGGYESDRNRLMLYDRRSGEVVEKTVGWDLSATEFAWAPSGEGWFVVADTQGTRQVFTLGVAGGIPEQITAGRHHLDGLATGPRSDQLYALRMQTERPFEVVRLDEDGGKSGEPVTDVNGDVYRTLALPTVEERRIESTDGQQVHCWVVYPPGFDRSRKYPLLTYCQGGPQSQVGQWFSFRWNFHLMAAQGYIVLGVNRRGLPGFGTAWNEQISGDWGGQAMLDLQACTDAMFQEPYVDREHTAAIGASFGGYSIYWLMGHDQDDRFCAMVAHCGVFNLESMYLSTEELFFPDWDLGGPFWRSPEVWKDYERFSPHRYVGAWDTPLMVIHGQRDFRVPLEQGLGAFTAAQLQGVPSRFVYFPTESHWVLGPQNGVLWHRLFFEWLDRWCKPEAPASPGADDQVRRHALEQVGDTAVAQLYADGFERLTLRDKLLCYHLANAAIAGRDIFIDQKYEHGLALRDLLEELYLSRSALDAVTAAEIERYTKRFWVHNGIHHAISARKELLRLSRAQFDAAVAAARGRGAALPAGHRLDLLFAVMTDPELDVSVTNKSPGEGVDPLAASANNLYAGVTSADLAGLAERYPLNSRLVKDGGTLREEVYRAGGDGVPAGRYAAPLENVIGHLTRALAHAPAPTRAALEKLIRYYRTGDPADWREFNIAWVADTDSVVDQINGFVEVYLDTRGIKGSWEAVVSFRNEEKTAAIEALAAEAQWFEDRMPWAEEFKKKGVKGISARAISVITETGDSGPVTPIGINLPNEADIRRDHGSKSVNLSNVVEGYERISSGASIGEFAWDEAEIERARRWGSIADDIHTNLHEVVGHASGQLRPEIENPAGRLGLYYSTLEEGRADLVGLYWIADPKLQDMGIVPDPGVVLAQYEDYARNALVQLRRVELGHKVEEDHMRNRQLVVLWLIDNTDAIEVARRDGKTYYRVRSVEAFRAGCGKLLAEVMRIKGTGDFKAGKALVDRYGTSIDPRLHEEVLARIEKLGLPSVTGFVQPELRLLHDAQGAVRDVEVFYPQSLEDQMLRWSGRRTGTR